MLFRILRVTTKLDLMNRPLLINSQRWKLWAGGAGAVVVLLVLFAAEWLSGLSLQPRYVAAALALVGTGALSVAALFVRCPSCGLNLVAWAISKKSAGTWLSWLVSTETCPCCGYRSHRQEERA